ncbi:Cof-type HAD-IIB family hydrolase [Alicyclobacillus sp. ALC3]|uniref:Cof-type HAD-IIB family hydrolase n=1 Tax=Alicyclobacillus sp. ALC3 TaxID=2796143 RepID=UPI00237968F3|nr:Cof-type HAD-IIB family hydrolase [Alicyclobacillus sp. ALC3]WDL97293.1 Cof-type HAD-IIB family hydrolase [Alicyclobacillus sp. ALC3]
MTIEFVFFDIDGTLVYNRKLVPSSIDAIGKLLARGIGVALCTGRSVLQTIELQQRLGIDIAVYFNGGLAMAHQEVVSTRPLPVGVVRRARSFFVERQLPVVMHTRTKSVTPAQLPGSLHSLMQSYDYPEVRVDKTDAYSDEDVFQANVFMAEDWDKEVLELFPECMIYRWHEEAIDLQKAGNDKSLGALDVLRKIGIAPERAVHFGDAWNDVGMFKALGTAVVMGNASEELKPYADYETTSVDQDGVERGLRHLGLI